MIAEAIKEVSNDKELYKKIAQFGNTPFNISKSTVDELKKNLSSNKDDSLRNLLGANKIEFYIDTINSQFKLDSVVIFEKNNYYVLYDVAVKRASLKQIIDSVYREKTRLIDANLYLIEK